MQSRVINMSEAKLQTMAQVKAFPERYGFIERALKRFGYARHGRTDSCQARMCNFIRRSA
jgi:hypothetical protein